MDEHADVAEFARGLHELVASADVRARIAGNAVRAARGRTWERAFAELLKCYDRCATKGKLADAARAVAAPPRLEARAPKPAVRRRTRDGRER